MEFFEQLGVFQPRLLKIVQDLFDYHESSIHLMNVMRFVFFSLRIFFEIIICVKPINEEKNYS